jgi:uncharacterized protein
VEKELTGILNRIVDRIINTAHPSRIILFGSAAAGKMKENSDFDLLVVMKNNVHRRTTSHLIYQSISDIGFATDIIVVTEDDISSLKNTEENFLRPALEEGKVLFAA